VLVTGPTGSGKTTTLYAALNALRSPTVNLVTCEDPVEIDLPGVNQSSVNDRVGLTFARQLRAILRQDPDIVLVGEMRDPETAEIAFRAAMTGHLVLSTLHSNDAPTSITRLLDMGVAPFLIASGLIGMVAQRLVRRLCPSCRQQGPVSEVNARLLSVNVADRFWYPGSGCSVCEGTGFKGRIGVHEVVQVDENMQRLIMDRAPSSDLRKSAVAAGMVPIREDALTKMRAGLTTPDEVLRQVYVKVEDLDTPTEHVAALEAPPI
jgi:type IV pilus assembly protein PilB